MKYLVTGGAGYIGAIVATMLLEGGHDVVVLDDYSTSDPDNVPAGAQHIRRNVHEVGQILTSDFDAVLHFAGLIAAGESMQLPQRYWHANTSGTFALLAAMRDAHVDNLVFSSTAAVYGNPKTLPLQESAETSPTSTYGATKLAADHAIASYCSAHGLGATSLRYFNVVGAYRGADGTWHGERHVPETHLVPLALGAAAGDRGPLHLYGEDYDTDDGTCVRDYIHVADLARAHLLALDAQEPGVHQIYNLGNGRGFSNRQVLDTVASVTGKPVPVIPAERRPGDPAVLVAQSDAARAALGWEPQRPKLSDMVEDAWEFYRR